MKTNRRSFRNYFIDKQFQTKYLILTILLLLSYTLIFIIILFFPSVFTLYFGNSLAEKNEAARTFLVLHNTVWPTTGAVILIFGILSIFLSHKIAGPVYRLKQTLTELIGGNLDSKVYLRKFDDLQELSTQVNLFSDELRNYVTSLKRDHVQLSNYIEQLERDIDSGNLSEKAGDESIKQVQEKIRTIVLTLDRFNSKS